MASHGQGQPWGALGAKGSAATARGTLDSKSRCVAVQMVSTAQCSTSNRQPMSPLAAVPHTTYRQSRMHDISENEFAGIRMWIL